MQPANLMKMHSEARNRKRATRNPCIMFGNFFVLDKKNWGLVSLASGHRAQIQACGLTRSSAAADVDTSNRMFKIEGDME